MTTTTTLHRYVRIERVDDYLRMGWLPLDTLAGTVHGQWSVHMAWIQCECGRVLDNPLR